MTSGPDRISEVARAAAASFHVFFTGESPAPAAVPVEAVVFLD